MKGSPLRLWRQRPQRSPSRLWSISRWPYKDLPTLFDTREALKPDAPVIHGKCPSNLVGRFDFGWGDVEQGWRESDHLFADTYVFQGVFHHPMENLGVVSPRYAGIC
jgi:CO/xanthine dehydrogenase Mo-binding subunit